MLQTRFEFMSKTPNTPVRFYDTALEGGEAKRLLLDRGNYYSTTGGHGGCRGCGEVTAIRQVMATNHAITDKRKEAHVAALEETVAALEAKLASLGKKDAARSQRIGAALKTLEKRLYLYEGGPTGNGPAGSIVANSTGCSSVYASTFPFNAYNDPWVNSLFQDAQPLAKGIFEGIAAQALTDIRALRTAKLELADAYVPEQHDAEMRLLSSDKYTKEELALVPTIITVGGDGATYDIGFGAFSRILASNTPIKVVVLNTGAYSNTGGQASTSSFIGQDSDLARFGAAHSGKFESAQGTRFDRLVPLERLRLLDEHGIAGTLPQEHDGIPDLYRLAGSARRLHALPGRARRRRQRLGAAGGPGRQEPDEPGLRA